MTWDLWIRAATRDDAAVQGRAWAEAEPTLSFRRVVSVEPRIHPTEGVPMYQVWTVVVEAPYREAETLTLGLVS